MAKLSDLVEVGEPCYLIWNGSHKVYWNGWRLVDYDTGESIPVTPVVLFDKCWEVT